MPCRKISETVGNTHPFGKNDPYRHRIIPAAVQYGTHRRYSDRTPAFLQAAKYKQSNDEAVCTIYSFDVFPPHQQPQIRLQLATLLESIISQQLLKTADGKGRVAAFEILHANSAIRSLIREGKSHQIPSIVQTSRKSGMITMDDSIYELYQAGKVTKDEAITFAQDKVALEKRLF